MLLAFDKAEQKIAWLQTLEDFFLKASNATSAQPFQAKKAVSEKKEVMNFAITKMSLGLKIPQITLNLFGDAFSKEHISLTATDSSLQLLVKPSRFEAELALSSFVVRDSALGVSSRRHFLKHELDFRQENLIKARVLSLGYEHPEYQGVNLLADLRFGRIELNYSPGSMASLLAFFLPERGLPATPGLLPKGPTVSSLPDKSPRGLEANRQHFSEAFGKKAGQTLVQADVFLTAIELNFIGADEREKALFWVSLKEGKVSLRRKAEELVVEGRLGNLQVTEESSEEVEILGLGEDKSSICEFEFRRGSEDKNSLKLGFNAIKIDMMMPSLRVISDYLSRNLLSLFKARSLASSAVRKSHFVLNVSLLSNPH